MDNQLKQKVSKALSRGEHLLWCGRPRIKLFSWADLLVIPFGLTWAYFPVTVTLRMWGDFASGRKGSDLFMLVFFSMFACLGIYISAGRFLHEYLLRKTRYFLITDRRVIVLSNFWPSTVRSQELKQLQTVFVVRQNEGAKAGTICFERIAFGGQITRSTAVAPLTYSSLAKLIFYDLDNLVEPLAVIKEHCRQIDIEEINALSSAVGRKMISLADFQVRGKQGMNDLAMAEALTRSGGLPEMGKVSEADDSLSKEEKDELVRLQRRFYVARSIGILAGAIAALLAGHNLLGSYAIRSAEAEASQHWTSTRGQIANLTISRSKGAPYLRNFKVYFTVDGKQYKCQRYSFADDNPEAKAEKYAFATAHKHGDDVAVFYDPNDASRNVINRSIEVSKMQQIMGAGFQAIGLVVMAFVALRLAIASGKKFEAKPVRSQSMAADIFLAGFLSIWCCMFFGGFLSLLIGTIAVSLKTTPHN
jgi:hypothetical protein